MDNWLENASSVLFVFYPGEQGGNGLADIVFGKANPAGRLPITFPTSADQYPEDYYSYTDDIYYKEDVFVGYRFFDAFDKEVLFPFGHGLSYTEFEYSNLSVSKTGGANTVRVQVDIENTGELDGDEVVQVYVHDAEASVPRPEKELKEFTRISLKSGEKQTVEFELGEEAFSFWDDIKKELTVEPGSYEIRVGASSLDIRLKEQIEL
jgi:beta-glucosidase